MKSQNVISSDSTSNDIMDQLYNSKLDELIDIFSGKSDYLQKMIKGMVQRGVKNQLKKKEVEYAKYVNQTIENVKEQLNMEWGAKYNKLKLKNSELVEVLKECQEDYNNHLKIQNNEQQSNLLISAIDGYYNDKLALTEKNNNLLLENIENSYKNEYDKRILNLELKHKEEIELQKKTLQQQMNEKLIEKENLLRSFYNDSLERIKSEYDSKLERSRQDWEASASALKQAEINATIINEKRKYEAITQEEINKIQQEYEAKINQLSFESKQLENEKMILDAKVKDLVKQTGELSSLESQNMELQQSLTNKMSEMQLLKQKERDHNKEIEKVKENYEQELYRMKVELKKQQYSNSLNSGVYIIIIIY